MRRSLLLMLLLVMPLVFAVHGYADEATVELIGGALNGVSVDGGILEVTATPEAALVGMVTTRAYNASSPSNIVPLVLVWSWGDHETSFQTIDPDIPSGESEEDINVNLTLPTDPGIYYLTIAFELEKTGAQVASLTNWRVDGGAAHWNDGVDIADWGDTAYDQSVDSHYVTTLYEGTGGFGLNNVPAAMIKVVVESPPEIISMIPAQNELHVSDTSAISVTFNGDMDEASFDGSFLVGGSRSGWCAGALDYDSISRTITFSPTDPFTAGELVTILLTTGIRTAAGTALDHSYSWSFTVATESGGGQYVVSTPYPVSATPNEVCSADLDGDRDVDIVTVGRDGGVTVCFNDGEGVFTVDTTYQAGFHATHVTVGDLNGDMLPDIANTAVNDGKVFVHMNTGVGEFASAVTYDVGTYPGGVCAADFDGDGHTDLACSIYGNNTISVIINKGDGTFEAREEYAAGSGAYGIFCGDVDLDGDIDLVSGCWFSANVYVSLNNGDGTFEAGVGYAAGAWPRCPVLADLDGDGMLDIAVANYSGRSVSILPGIGDGTFSGQTTYDVTLPYWVCTGDLDGDGAIDLIAPEYTNNRLIVLTNDGFAGFSVTDTLAVGVDRLYGVCSADYNGDGVLDLSCIGLSSDLVVILNQSQTGVEEDPDVLPARFSLHQNYPNPFNPVTVIEYSLSRRSAVKLTVFNTLGQTVKVLIDEVRTAGIHQVYWDGTDMSNQRVATGVYFYSISAAETVETRKMMLIK